MANRQRNKDGDFARTFKPAKVLTATTIDQIVSQVYVRELKEDYDNQDNQMLYANQEAHESIGVEGLKSIYILETASPLLKPNIRKVKVKRKEDYSQHSYLVEAESNTRGLTVVMLKEVPKDKQIYCNIRVMPFSNIKDLLAKSNEEVLEIELPRTNIIKLNITLTTSMTGEILYKTHKTEVMLENTTEAQVVYIKQNLEFTGARIVAHLLHTIIQPTFAPIPNPHSSQMLACTGSQLISPENQIKILTGLCLLCLFIDRLATLIDPSSRVGPVFGLLSTLLGIAAFIRALNPAQRNPTRAIRQDGYREIEDGDIEMQSTN
ncbi:MAG: hypothetical protein AAFP19_10645 [Bacteroidota bacterium]